MGRLEEGLSDTFSAADALAKVPLFSRLPEDVLDALAEQTEGRSFSKGEAVAEQGTANDGLLVITDGELEVHRGGRLLKVLGPGDYVGDMSLIDGGPHSVTVTATQGGGGVFLSGSQFRVAIRHQPDVAISVMEVLVGRLRETLTWLDEAN